MVKKQTHYTAILLINLFMFNLFSSCFQASQTLAVHTRQNSRSSSDISLDNISQTRNQPLSANPSLASNTSININEDQIDTRSQDAQSISSDRSYASAVGGLAIISASNESLNQPSQPENLPVNRPEDQNLPIDETSNVGHSRGNIDQNCSPSKRPPRQGKCSGSMSTTKKCICLGACACIGAILTVATIGAIQGFNAPVNTSDNMPLHPSTNTNQVSPINQSRPMNQPSVTNRPTPINQPRPSRTSPSNSNCTKSFIGKCIPRKK